MKTPVQLKSDQYWASIVEHEELLNHLDTKIRTYYDDLRAIGLLSVWERSFRAYYGGRVSQSMYKSSLFEASRLSPGGKQGEKTKIKANHYRNLIRHLHQLTTQQKPNAQARATNTDYKSQSQTILANGLEDYYWKEKNVGSIVRDASELGIIYGESFVHAPWDPSEGQVYAQDQQGLPIYEGDQKYELFSPINVIRDPSLRSNKQSEWTILKAQENKWNLATKYQDLAEDILASSAYDPEDDMEPTFQLRSGDSPLNPDIINLYTMYHKRTETMREGRLVVFLRGLVLFDGPLPYKNIPIYRLAAEQLYDSIYGYSLAFDLLGVQEGIDELHTMLMSNNKTFGAQSIWIKDTDKLQTSSLGGGMKLFKSEEPPTPIQLTKSAPESYTYLDKLEHTAELLSGISSTVRGNPEANLKSGNALALVVSQSIQFASGLEDAINRLVEELATGLIDNLRDFSKTQRVANIVGESQRPFAKTFEAKDLSEINRFVVEQVNPLSKTIAGRAEIANNLLQQGLIKDPEQYIMVLSTGNIDPAMENTQSEMLRIRAENEDLRNDGSPVALITDNHALDIREHKSVLDSPEARSNPDLVQRVLSHIQQHIDLARSMDPALIQILGQTPLPPPVPQMPMGNPMNPAGNGPQAKAENIPPVNMPQLPPGSPPQAHAAYDQVQPPPGIGSK